MELDPTEDGAKAKAARMAAAAAARELADAYHEVAEVAALAAKVARAYEDAINTYAAAKAGAAKVAIEQADEKAKYVKIARVVSLFERRRWAVLDNVLPDSECSRLYELAKQQQPSEEALAKRKRGNGAIVNEVNSRERKILGGSKKRRMWHFNDAALNRILQDKLSEVTQRRARRCDVHGIVVLEAIAGLPQQGLHTDAAIDDKYWQDVDHGGVGEPCGFIVAIQDGTKIDIGIGRLEGAKGMVWSRKTIVIPKGSVFIFKLSLVHGGSAYDSDNIRIHGLWGVQPPGFVNFVKNDTSMV